MAIIIISSTYVMRADSVANIIISATSFIVPKSYLEYSEGKLAQMGATDKKERPDNIERLGSMKVIYSVISDLFLVVIHVYDPTITR